MLVSIRGGAVPPWLHGMRKGRSASCGTPLATRRGVRRDYFFSLASKTWTLMSVRAFFSDSSLFLAGS